MDKKPASINVIFLFMILSAVVVAAFNGKMDQLTKASFDSAKAAVTLAIGLIGPMALWLGLMKVAEDGGLLRIIAKIIRPLMIKLFPDVPPEHPAMSAMIMNMSANALGLGNAATPMGIKAMKELQKLSKQKEVATNAMCLFLAINTSNVTLLPLGVITVRAAAGAKEPASILLPTLIATTISTLVAIISAKLLEKRSPQPVLIITDKSEQNEKIAQKEDTYTTPLRKKLFISFVLIIFLGAIIFKIKDVTWGNLSFLTLVSSISSWIIPILICGFLIFGYLRGVNVYESLTEGAKEGFETAIRIIPYLVAIFVAIGMLRASGALELFVSAISPFVQTIGMPPEAMIMALMRPLSGSGAFGIMSEIVSKQPDSYLSFLVSIMQGSTETTFYVLAVYFGSVGIKDTRHALASALIADVAGILAALGTSKIFF